MDKSGGEMAEQATVPVEFPIYHVMQTTIYNLLIDGAGYRIRTDDLLITNQLLYQLS